MLNLKRHTFGGKVAQAVEGMHKRAVLQLRRLLKALQHSRNCCLIAPQLDLTRRIPGLAEQVSHEVKGLVLQASDSLTRCW